jgi:hypothetical protein
MAPVGMTSIARRDAASPIFMIEPLPNWRSICEMATSIARSRSAMPRSVLASTASTWAFPAPRPRPDMTILPSALRVIQKICST